MPERNLSPTQYLDDLYGSTQRSLSFCAKTPAEFQEWAPRLRAKLAALLRMPPERAPLEPEIIGREECEGYVREKVLFQADSSTTIVAYLLIPEGRTEPGPALIAVSGHGRGMVDVCGIAETAEDRQGMMALNYPYGVYAVKQGYVVLAPESIAFGERIGVADQPGIPHSCRTSSWTAILLGRTLFGMRVRDTMVCVDYLKTRPEVDGERIGCIGLSNGGTIGLFTAALDERISVSVISGYLNTFKASYMSILHCECNYIPDIALHMEMADVACAIAPRPALYEQGENDPIYPIRPAREAFAQVKRCYEVLGCPERTRLDVFPGEHQWYGQTAWEWLREWL